MYDHLTFPFNRDTFLSHYNAFANDLFSKLDLEPTVSKSNMQDAYSIWFDENFRWACSMGLRGDLAVPDVMNAIGDRDFPDPSHLKKASALACAINRTKPITKLDWRNGEGATAEDPDYTNPKVKIQTLFPNEYFALISGLAYVHTEETIRPDMPPIEKFDKHLGFSCLHGLDDDYVISMCRYFRLRSPSPSSLYQIFRSLTFAGYKWRKST